MKTKRTYLSHAVAAAFLALSTQLAFALDETEPAGTMGANDSFSSAQPLVFTTDTVEVRGSIGVTDPNAAPIPDVDFYSFEASEGDVVTFDIDDGMKGMTLDVRHVDTILAVFAPGPQPGTWYQLLQEDHGEPVDDGSSPYGGSRDARIDPQRLPVTGTYILGVSSFPRFFMENGEMESILVSGGNASFPNGAYRLIISGVTPMAPVVVTPPPVEPAPTPVVTPPPVVTPAPAPVVQYVNIDVKPGKSTEAGSFNPKAQGSLPVVLLSSRTIGSTPEFRPMEVKRDSLTFGRKGDEKSLLRCNKEGADMNRDGIPDLLCHFDNPSANFEHSSTVGIVKGRTGDGRAFQGSGNLKVVPKAKR